MSDRPCDQPFFVAGKVGIGRWIALPPSWEKSPQKIEHPAIRKR
jgi:hypothetical protein